MCFSSRRDRTLVPRRCRLRLRFLPRDRLWRLKALAALILPVPVLRNRFTALRLVFNFGIAWSPPRKRKRPSTSGRLRNQPFCPGAYALGAPAACWVGAG